MPKPQKPSKGVARKKSVQPPGPELVALPDKPHSAGPWASIKPMGGTVGGPEIWTALPDGTLRRLATLDPSSSQGTDAALMAAAPQLAHEIRASLVLLERLLAAPGVLDVLADLCRESDLESALVHRVGCLRHISKFMGPQRSPGTYEIPVTEARWHVPEQAYRTLGDPDDPAAPQE